MTAAALAAPAEPGPLVLAALLCGLPPGEADPAALPEPWRGLAAAVLADPGNDSVVAFKAALAGHPDAAAITAAIFAVDPTELSRGPGRGLRWEPPIPFGEHQLPPFPTAALPPWLGDFVRAEALATQTPPDLAGVLALAVLSTACAGRAMVRPRGDWLEPVNLYAMVVLPPGHRKSAVFASVARPIQAFEADAAHHLGPAIARAEARRKVAEQALHRAEDAAAKASGDERATRLAEVDRLAAELGDFAVPARPRLVVDDCSPERLATLLRDQGGRIAVLSPEGGIFDLMAGRYSQGGGPNFEHFLKGHAGDPILVDRVGRPADLIPHPAITLGLAVQPAVLRGLMARPGFHGKGLLARFLYALPASPLGHRLVNPPAVPAAVHEAYAAQLQFLLADSFGDLARGGPPPTLTLAEPAAARLEAFAHALEPRLGEGGDFERLIDWAGKLVGLVVRLAGLLHVAHHASSPEPWARPIDDATLAAAVRLGEYATAHARAAYDAMGADPVVDDARYLLRWMRQTGIARFNRRELYRATRGRFRRVEALDPPLAALERHAYVRQRPVGGQAGPGRKPSPTYDVSPHISAPLGDQRSDAPSTTNSGHSDHSVQGGVTSGPDHDADHENPLPP